MKIEALEGPVERIAAWRADESGAARADRLVLVFGVAAVTALLAFSMIGQDDPAATATSTASPAAEGAETPGQAAPEETAPERRVVSTSGRAAPEPPQVEGQPSGPAYRTDGFIDRSGPRPDNEQAILAAQTAETIAEIEAARAAEDEAARAAGEEAARAAEEAAPGSEPAATGEAAADASP